MSPRLDSSMVAAAVRKTDMRSEDAHHNGVHTDEWHNHEEEGDKPCSEDGLRDKRDIVETGPMSTLASKDVKFADYGGCLLAHHCPRLVASHSKLMG